ncbi:MULTISPECIES: nitrilase-related carbon-nitrogen hydrolase [unclassified Streptomyces]|uniref:nitrilase-related carbon-nitrogen hydrolase n=1 Tax=unclassified Streptomyces TaxID=2593676 RepID=UPI000BEF8EB4|nr:MULTISPECIES: nitrilase-related carbon-nitrogen hydrolase [unclassified Streptomyces]
MNTEPRRQPRRLTAYRAPARYPEREGGDFYDSISVVAADGQVVANYRKTHLYGAAERRNYSFGQELPPLVAINGMSVGVLNCYECEFPPLYQYLAEHGAQIVLGPTAADWHFRLADGTMSRVPYQDATVSTASSSARSGLRMTPSTWLGWCSFPSGRRSGQPDGGLGRRTVHHEGLQTGSSRRRSASKPGVRSRCWAKRAVPAGS